MTPDEILDQAADLIDFNGLVKGRLRDKDGRYCSVGAMLQGLPEDINLGCDLWDQTLEFFGKYIGGDIVFWNNAPERTQSEVVDAMRGAAKAYRERNDGNGQH